MSKLYRLAAVCFCISLVAVLGACAGVQKQAPADEAGQNLYDAKPIRGVTSYNGSPPTYTPSTPSSFDLLDSSSEKLGDVVVTNTPGTLTIEFAVGSGLNLTKTDVRVRLNPPSEWETELAAEMAQSPTITVGAEEMNLSSGHADGSVSPLEPNLNLTLGETEDPLPADSLSSVIGSQVDEFDPAATHTVELPLSGLEGTYTAYIAASAVVVGGSDPIADIPVQLGGSTGGVDEFYPFELELPEIPLDLPAVPVMMNARGTGNGIQTYLYEVPEGYDVDNCRWYQGWCVDRAHTLRNGEITLRYSYDWDLPAHCQDNDWDLVNYVINHKQGYEYDVQLAVWYFIGGGNEPGTADAQAMVDDALENGEGYEPGTDDVVAVICDAGVNSQTTVIEVPTVEQPTM